MKLGIKLLLAPLLTAIVLLVSGQINALLMSREVDAMQGIFSESLAEVDAITDVQHQLGLLHAGVYRTMGVIGSMDEAKIKDFRSGLAKQLATVKKQASALGERPDATEPVKAAVTTMTAQVDKYGSQADSAIDLSSVDPNTGIAAMQGADATFQDLNKTVSALADDYSRHVQASGQAAIVQARNTHWALTLVGVLAAIAAVGLSWWMQKRIVEDLRRAGQAANDVAAGNLTTDIHTSRQDEVGDLMRALSAMQESLSSVVQRVRSGSDSVSTASAEIAQGNNDLSGRTEQQASALEETAASMEELSSTVRQNADNARQANQLASSAAEVAARGGEVVSQVVSTMDEINTSSKKIADIIGVIDGIAFQTNILALNAAVEAARAGEQGRGFAVVAGEVRSLAGRSAEAAKEIKGLIGASVERVDAGSRLVADAGRTMQEIVGSVQRVSDIIGEITAAAAEQSDGIGQVNGAVTQLDQMTQQNAALVEQSAAAAESLKDQADRLAAVVGKFRVEPLDAPFSSAEDGR